MTNTPNTPDGTWPEDLDRRQTAIEAMKLRRDGKTWDEIAQLVGYSSRQAAHKAVKRVLERVEGETAEDYREVMAARYEALYAKAWDSIAAADAEGQLVGEVAADRVRSGCCGQSGEVVGVAGCFEV